MLFSLDHKQNQKKWKSPVQVIFGPHCRDQFRVTYDLGLECRGLERKKVDGEKMFSSCHERGTKKKILSPREESNLRPSDCSTTEPQRLYGERGPSLSSCMTRVLHTAMVGDVHSVMFMNFVMGL